VPAVVDGVLVPLFPAVAVVLERPAAPMPVVVLVRPAVLVEPAVTGLVELPDEPDSAVSAELPVSVESEHAPARSSAHAMHSVRYFIEGFPGLKL
jgi:hypothetical protein